LFYKTDDDDLFGVLNSLLFSILYM